MEPAAAASPFLPLGGARGVVPGLVGLAGVLRGLVAGLVEEEEGGRLGVEEGGEGRVVLGSCLSLMGVVCAVAAVRSSSGVLVLVLCGVGVMWCVICVHCCPCSLCMCALRVLPCRNVFPHSGQLYGFSPVWMRLCDLSVLDWRKPF